jgi:hypothetical protein
VAGVVEPTAGVVEVCRRGGGREVDEGWQLRNGNQMLHLLEVLQCAFVSHFDAETFERAARVSLSVLHMVL